MNDDIDTLLRQYLDGDLPPAQEPNVLRRIAGDPEARELLRLELLSRDALSNPPEVPDGFADCAMAAIETAEAKMVGAETAEAKSAPASLSLDRLAERVWTWLLGPITVQIRPGLVAAAAVLLVGAAVALWPAPRPLGTNPPVAQSTASQRSGPATTASHDQKDVVWTRFVYADDEASSVAVAGDFKAWEPIPLSKRTVDGKTIWTGIVPVPRGEHQYMFVIDGSQWVTDPLAPVQRSDGFGNKNAVLQL